MIVFERGQQCIETMPVLDFADGLGSILAYLPVRIFKAVPGGDSVRNQGLNGSPPHLGMSVVNRILQCRHGRFGLEVAEHTHRLAPNADMVIL